MLKPKYSMPIKFIFLIITLLFAISCKADVGDKTLFAKYGNGLDTLSVEGETDIWDMSITKNGDTVTILETFYNNSSIWVGLSVEGENLIKNEPAHVFRYNGEVLGSGAHGGFMSDPRKPEESFQYRVIQPSSWFDVKELPDEFTLEFAIIEEGLKRAFEFEIPLKRSDREVIRRRQ